jgi:DNA-binding NarL/FixJ family response regulator
MTPSAPRSATRVLIADDHPPTRRGVRSALEQEPDFVVCAEAATADAAVAAAEQWEPDVCLLDIRMPGGGIAAAAEIGRRVPQARIVMLTVSRDDDDLFDALRAGAIGYLLKDIERGRLAEALRSVVGGEAQLPGALVARLVEEFRFRETRRHRLRADGHAAELSRREWEILELLSRGCSTREIAEALFVAEVTVRSHVSAILRKLRVKTREDAIRLLESR